MFSAAKRSTGSHMIWFQLFGILVALTEDHDVLKGNTDNSFVQLVSQSCCPYYSTCFATNVCVASCQKLQQHVAESRTFCNNFFQLAVH